MILVTGATGFVGRRVVSDLAAAGHRVRALVRTPARESVLAPYDVETVTGDVLDPASLARACEGVSSVIHLVAVVRQRGALTFRRVNHEGTRNLLEAASDAGVGRVVHVSTVGAASDPAVPYLYSRWMAEEEVVRSAVAHTILRFSVGFGEGDEFFNVLAAQVKLSPLVPIVGDGRTRFQPIAVEDVATCIVRACQEDGSVGKTLELGGPQHLTYEEMVDLIAAVLDVRIAKVHVPPALMRPAVAVMEALTPRPPVTAEQLKMLNVDNTAELDSVERAFGFVPRSLRSGIGYISRIGLWDALRTVMGFIPAHMRDH